MYEMSATRFEARGGLNYYKIEESLSVVLDEVLDELGVAEVDGAGVVLVEFGDLGHLAVGEAEVEDIQILRHTLLVGALGDGHDAALRQPAQGDLRGILAVLATDGGQLRAFDDAVHALSAQWTPGHHPRAELGVQRFDGGLLDEGIALQLVDHGLHIHIVGEVEEATRLEVAHADGAHLAVAVGTLHGAPGAEDVAVGLMDEQQVDVVGLQLAQALVNAAGGTLFAGVADPHLGDEEEM